MKLKVIIFVVLLAILLFIVNPQVIQAQVCIPTPETTITTNTSGDVVIRLSSALYNNNLIIRGDDISLMISYYPDRDSPTPHFRISNGYRWGNPDYVELAIYNRAHEEILDTSSMREPWLNLWVDTTNLISELNNNKEFWSFIGDTDDSVDDLQLIFSDIVLGHFVPYVNYDNHALRYIWGYQHEIDAIADGYSMRYGETVVSVVTPNDFEDIYIVHNAQQPGDRWIFHVDSINESVSVQWGSSDCSMQIGEDEYAPVVTLITEVLTFFEDNEFEGLGDLKEYLKPALTGLNYPIVPMYTDRYSEYDMIGPIL